jgi:glycosyltransferase involved in cell wall biosynthesis
MARNPRYVWLGDAPRWRALRRLAASRALVLTSRSEGGANVVCEAIACGVPVITSAIPGALGLLGADWPATFPVGDTARLTGLLSRAETDPAWLAGLGRRCKRLASTVLPSRERALWRQLLSELGVGSTARPE